jgi:hypothetical protein
VFDPLLQWMKCEPKIAPVFALAKRSFHVQRVNQTVCDVDFDHGSQKQQ